MSKETCNHNRSMYAVSEISLASGGIDSLFFTVLEVCKECNHSQVVAMHTLKLGMDKSLFREHHKRTIEFYTGIK